MTCKSKNLLCGENRTNAVCVRYTGYLPDWSLLKDEDCLSVDEVVEELYNKTTEIEAKVDFSDLESECLNLQDELENTTPKSVAQALITSVEELKCNPNPVPLKDLNITCYNLDFKCLVDPCDVPITKLSTLLQLIINKLPCE